MSGETYISGATISFQQRIRIHMRDLFTCQCCGQALPPHSVALTLDQLNPLAGTEDDNLLTLCRPCQQHRMLPNPAPLALLPPAAFDTISSRGTFVATTLKEAATAFSIDVGALVGAGRHALLVQARRQVIVCLRNAGFSLKEIGRVLHRDHSTIIHHLKT